MPPQGFGPQQPAGPYGQFGPPPGYGGFGPPPRRRGPWRWLAPVLALVVIAAVVIPLVTLSSGHSGGKHAADTASTGLPASSLKQWQIPVSASDQAGFALAEWARSDELIVADSAGVTAYARATGAKRWQLTVPGASGSTYFCGASQTEVNDEAAVAYGSAVQANSSGDQQSKCQSVGLVDLRTGRFVWTKQLLQSSADLPDGISLTIAGGNVFAGAGGGVALMSLANGNIRTTANVSSQDYCTVNDVMPAAPNVIYTAQCMASSDESNYIQVSSMNATTGTVVGSTMIQASTAHVPSAEFASMVSASPLVILVSGTNDTDNSVGASYVILNKALQVSQLVPAGTGNSALDTSPTLDPSNAAASHGFYRGIVADGMLVALTVVAPGGVTQANQLVAYDLSTGQQRWSLAVPGTSVQSLVSASGTTLVAAAIKLSPGDTEMLRVDVATGKLIGTKSQHIVVPGAGQAALPGELNLDECLYVADDGRLYAAYGAGVNGLISVEPVVFSIG